MFKKLILVAAALAVISCVVQAAPNVQLKYSGPSGQGDLIFWSPSTGVTNLVMGTNGITVFAVPAGVGIVYTNATLTQQKIVITNVVGGATNLYTMVTNTVLSNP